MFALGGVVMLAGSYAAFSLLPAGCSPQATNKSGGGYTGKTSKGTKTVEPKKTPANTEYGATGGTTEEGSAPKKPRDLKFRDRDTAPKEAVPVPAESTRELHEPL